MNYYMPYFNMYPNMISGITSVIPNTSTSKGIISRLFGKGLNWSSILNSTQKTLGLVNQAIPIIKQVTPVMKNAKTIFKVMNEFKKVDNQNSEIIPSETVINNNISDNFVESNIINFDGSPTFFIN